MYNERIRQDHFFKKAKEQGYPARSVFKLSEIDKKYQLIRSGNFVLDLGCAPGSWLKYLSEKVGKRGKVIGIDLQDINLELAENTVFIKKDINDLSYEDLGEKRFNIIVSDMAPKTTGGKSADAARSLELNEVAFEVVKKYLKKGGHFLFKVFESREAHDFTKDLTKYFKEVKRYSPKATRKASSEFYVTCKSYKS